MFKPNLRITAYCIPCNRKIELEEGSLPQGGRPIGYRMRCIQCGGRGQVIASPRDHNPSNQMMGPDFYGLPKQGPPTKPLANNRRGRR